MNKIKYLAALLPVALVLACGSPAPASGTVIKKEHDDATSTTINVCAGWDANHNCTINVPVTTTTDEKWKLKITNGTKTGWVDVSRATYENTAVGDDYEPAPTA